VLVFSPIARGAVRLWAMTPVLLVAYSLLFVWALKSMNGGGSSFVYRLSSIVKQKKESLPIFLFATLAIISFVYSIYKHDSFYALLRLFAYIGLYYLVAFEFDHAMRRRIIWLVIAAGGGLSLFGLLQYFGLFSRSWWIPKQFLASTYVNHNHFAGYLELVIPSAAAILTARSTQKSMALKLALVASLVVMASAFILTQSRGAWVSLGSSLLVMLLLMVSGKNSRARMMMIAALLIVAVVSLVYFTGDMMGSRMATITSAGEGEDVSGGRFKIWQGAIGMIKERPLIGAGIGDFDHGFYRYRPLGFNARAVYAHNDYLHMAAEMGVFAPLIMIWIFAVVIRDGLAKRGKSPYAFGCAIGVLSLAIHGAVDFNFHIPANMLLFTVWASIITGER
jgi:O-antigen ligase